MEAPPCNLQDLKDLPLTIGWQIVHVWTGQGCFGGKRRTFSILGRWSQCNGSPVYLDCIYTIDLCQLILTTSSSKPSTCFLDHIPTKLLKEELALFSTFLLDMMNLSLLTGYEPHSFKLSVIKVR